jgi:transposase
VRVTTAFNRVLQLVGASVVSVAFSADGVVVGIRNRRRRLRCACGYSTRAVYDRSVRRWRHLDMGVMKVWVEGEIRRLDCKRCARVVTEEVPWARPRARHTRDFEDVVAWLCQRSDQTTVATLLRCSWQAVHNIVGRVVAEHIDTSRLDDVYRIGVDEISYRRGHWYLTIVADHDTGAVIWVDKTKSGAALGRFYEALGPERVERLEAVSMDLGTAYRDATRRHAPGAVVCFDPFHVVQLANRALDAVYKAADHGTISGRQWRKVRGALRSGAERLDDDQAAIVNQIRRTSRRLWRAWDLKEELRWLYRGVKPSEARTYLRSWLRSATRSRIPAFVNLAHSIRRNFDGIIAAVELGLSNSRLEGINSKIRVIQRRGYGHHTAEALAAMIYLCLGGITITLPTQR